MGFSVRTPPPRSSAPGGAGSGLASSADHGGGVDAVLL